ncbi:hypothetical protein N185_35300 [Sinorhizobium sp. GW3]|nr:hypothetical protein N185_35300 [Sinorhizobium sp. GW3]
MTSVALKYRWRRPSSERQTLQGSHGDRTIGRVERAIAGDHWLWFVTCGVGIIDIARHRRLNGAARTAAHAAAACEESYEAFAASIAAATS